MPRPKKVPTAPLPDAIPAETVASIPAPVLPQPTSPAVLQLQASIVDIIAARSEARNLVTAAQQELYFAQAKVQGATGQLQALEQEVQYRMGVIAQLENRTQQNPYQPMPAGLYEFPQPGAALAGISSEPTLYKINDKRRADPNDFVNRGHADRAML